MNTNQQDQLKQRSQAVKQVDKGPVKSENNIGFKMVAQGQKQEGSKPAIKSSANSF